MLCLESWVDVHLSNKSNSLFMKAAVVALLCHVNPVCMLKWTPSVIQCWCLNYYAECAD